MITKSRKKLYELIDPSHADDRASRAFNLGMLLLITLNVIAVILETEKALYLHYQRFFEIFDLFSVAAFTIEYILRVWSCVEDTRYNSPVRGRISFALQPMSIIDLFSFLPFYLPYRGLDLRFIRAVRLFRLFRLLKMGRYSKSLNTLVNVLKSKKEELSVTLYSGLILLIVSSSLMYFVEHEAQPEVFPSIPSAMWWGAVTLTTVGYGDVYPKTAMGKFLGAFIAVLGIGLFALPAGIIASGFASEIQHKSSEPQMCPHCGKDINSPPEKE